MKVLFVTTSFPRYPTDHAGSFICRLANSLLGRGIEVEVVAPGTSEAAVSELMDNVEVHRPTYFLPSSMQRVAYGRGIPANLKGSRLAWLQLPLLIAAMTIRIARSLPHVDIVHCHWLPTVWMARVAMAFSRHRPLVFTNWGSDTRASPRWLTRRSLELCDELVSTAAETDAHFKAAGYSSFHSIMAPVDEKRFRPKDPDTSLLSELGVSHETPVISFVGRLCEFKDPITFIQAIARLKADGVTAMGLIAGDGELRKACEQEITRLDVSDRVQLLGMRNDPERLLSVSKAFVHISPIENTWSNSIAEAMFMGIPVIMTAVGHTRETFNAEKNCLLVPPKDPAALATAINRLIQEPDLHLELATGAEILLRTHGKDSDTIGRKLETLYQQMLEPRRSSSDSV